VIPYHADRRLALDAHDKQRRQDIYKWLAAPDYESKHLNAVGEWEKDTGSWFMEGESFHGWKGQPKSFLWLHGKGMFSACLMITTNKSTQLALGRLSHGNQISSDILVPCANQLVHQAPPS
jgi:hypothetical protein